MVMVAVTVASEPAFFAVGSAESGIRERLQAWEERSGARGEEVARTRVPEDMGVLAGSITHAMGVVSVSTPYAKYVHGPIDGSADGHRTEPHFVPRSVIPELAAWAGRHGITSQRPFPAAGYLVAASIARHGTPIVAFLHQAQEELRGEIIQDAVNVLAEIKADLLAGG